MTSYDISINQYAYDHRRDPAFHDRMMANNLFASSMLALMEEDYLYCGEFGAFRQGTASSLPPAGRVHAFREAVRRIMLRTGRWDGDDAAAMEPYLLESIVEIDPSEVACDPYVRAMQGVRASEGDWDLSEDLMPAWTLAPCDDILVKPGDIQIPRLGFCAQDLRYPVVREGGREWMAIKPSEIRSMAPDIAKVRGDVLVLGAGAGYFPIMAAAKDSVTRVTVVDRDPDVLRLLSAHIMPRFPEESTGKISLVKAEAVEYLRSHKDTPCQYAFVDLWHDPSDGQDIYRRIRAEEVPSTRYLYWMERSILAALRWRMVFG